MPPQNNLVQSAPAKIGRFKASKIIVKESWAVLKQDKEIMLFPIMSSIATLITVAILGVIFYFVFIAGNLTTESFENNELLGNFVAYVALLIYYLIIFFIVNFFEAGLYIIVQARFSGQNLSFSDGFNGAMKYVGKLFVWSLISATVGVILRIISDKSQMIGKIVAGIFGAAWNILTYFSLPSLVIGNLSIRDSFKESAAIIRKTWGETLIVNFGVGLFFFIIGFLIFAVSVAIVIIIPSIYVFATVLALFILAMIIMSIISTTLGSIFKLVLFNYARTGQIPQGFSPEVVIGAVKK